MADRPTLAQNSIWPTMPQCSAYVFIFRLRIKQFINTVIIYIIINTIVISINNENVNSSNSTSDSISGTIRYC